MILKLVVSRWQCRHGKCKRRTFSDQLQEIARPYAHRATRMAEIVGLIGRPVCLEAGIPVTS